MQFERGYHPEILGEYAARMEARNRLALLALLSLAGIGLILHTDFGSARIATLVFVHPAVCADRRCGERLPGRRSPVAPGHAAAAASTIGLLAPSLLISRRPVYHDELS
jgi:hypothetical protein